VPPEQTEKIQKRWGDVNVIWYAGGELVNFQKSYCRRGEQKFMRMYLPKKKSDSGKADAPRKKEKKEKKEKSPRKKKASGNGPAA
jgi:hypothetical protein